MASETPPALPRAPARALRGALRRHPWRSAGVAALLVLGLALAVVLDADVQKRWLLPRIAPLVDSVDVEHLRLTPWSLSLRGVSVEWRGLRAAVAEADVGFNPLGLITDTVVVSELRLAGASVDLTRFEPAPPSTAPFPGLLQVLDAGYGVALDDVDVAVDVLLADGLELKSTLRGGGVRPHVSGGLDYVLDVRAGAQAVGARGRLTIDQLSHGRFRRVRTDDVLTLALPELPAPERVATSLEIAPAPGRGRARYLARVERGRQPPPPEAVVLRLRSLDDADAARATLEFNGLYRGADGSLRGRYALEAVDALLAPYAATLPAFESTAQGLVGLQTVTGAIDLTLDAATTLQHLERVLGDNPALPPRLVVHSAATLALQGPTLAVTRFEHQLAAPDVAAGAPPLAQAALHGPLVIDLDRPRALLDTERALALLQVDGLPLPWLNGLLGAQQLGGGQLHAAFELASDDEARLALLPLVPTRLAGVAVTEADAVLAPRLEFSALPALRIDDQALRVRVDGIVLGDGARALLGGKLRMLAPLAPAADEATRVSFDVEADVDALSALPTLAARRAAYPLPEALRLRAKGDIDVRGAQLTVAGFDAQAAQPGRPDLARVVARQAFALPTAGETFRNPRGELLQLRLRAFDLAWLSAFVEGVDLRGTLANADLLLTAPGKDRLSIAATAPLRIDGLALGLAGEPVLGGLDVVAAPVVDYSPTRVALTLHGLRVASRTHALVSGELAVDVPLAQDAAAPLSGEGELELDLRALAAQPALRRALGRAAPELALDASLRFALTRTGDVFTLQRLRAELDAGRRAKLSLSASPGLEVRPRLARGERLARHVVGDVALEIRDLSSAVIERFVPIEGIDFAEINADLRLASDGRVLRADSAAPLRLERVRVSAGERPLLQPFELSTKAAFTVEEQELAFELADLALEFDGAPAPGLNGRLTARVEPGRTVPLRRLSTAFAAALPQWLSQPAVMPGHGLRAGALSAEIDVAEDGAIAARALLDGLASGSPLAISRIELPVTGRMAADGRGFAFSAPLVAQGRSGVSNASVVADYAPDPDRKGLLKLRLDSALFYLNDLLATVDALSPARRPARPPAPGAAGGAKGAAPIAVDRTRDARAAWDVLPYGTDLEYAIDTLFYTDYLAFRDVRGKLGVRPGKLSLSGVSARFHDSPMKLDGTLAFRPAQAEPYALDMLGTVSDFNLHQFFKELVPGERPRIKGLFSVRMAATGEMPNLGELRNETLFDVRMRSLKGVFRPLPPSSPLLVGTSDMLGFVGEGLSYVPTGGFGAGVVARLVNYISRIDYDIVDIHLRRPESRDVEIARFLVRSKTIELTARGGIKRAPDLDILDSPLELQANLDMSGRGAAILYSMGLLRQEKNEDGYWRGPEFRIWGTPSRSESNFSDIVRQASDGTVKGGITRPLSGLIGNVKYRWFGDPPREFDPEDALLPDEDSGGGPATK